MGTYSNQIQGLDIPSIYLAAQTYRQRQTEMDRAQQERQRQDQIRNLYAGAMQGDAQAAQQVQALDPVGYVQLEKQQQANAATQQDQAIQNITTTGNMLRAVKASPNPAQTFQVVRNQAIQMGLGNEQTIPTAYDPQWVDAILAQADAMSRSRTNANDTPDIRNFLFSESHPNFVEYQLAQRRAGAPMNPYAMDLTKAQQSAHQEGVFNAQQLLNKLDYLDTFDATKLLTIGRKVTDYGKGLVAHTGMAPEAWEQDIAYRESFEETVNDIFNIYRKEITGAGAAVAELRDLRRAIMNTSMSPPQFEAAKQRLRQFTEQTLALRKQLLDEGMLVGTDQFGKEFNKRWKRSPTAAKGDTLPPGMAENLAARAAQRAQQLDSMTNQDGSKRYGDDQILEILRSEGLAR